MQGYATRAADKARPTALDVGNRRGSGMGQGGGGRTEGRRWETARLARSRWVSERLTCIVSGQGAGGSAD